MKVARPAHPPPPDAADNRLLDRLDRESLTVLVLAENREMFRSSSPGVAPLLEVVERFPQGFAGATVADRVVGGCAARVFLHLRVGRVLAEVGSVAARAVLDAAGVDFRYRRGVFEIRNRAGTDACPFEQLARHLRHPGELIPAMRRRLAELKSGARR